MQKEGKNILQGERNFLNKIKANPLDKKWLKIYSLWLENRDLKRATQLKKLINCLENNLQAPILTIPKGIREAEREWLEIIGVDVVGQIQKAKLSDHLENIKSLLRPAYRMIQRSSKRIEVGTSKIGGYPDLPEKMTWPKGKDCTILYEEDCTTKGIEDYAGFLAQVNLEELSFGFEERFPKKGLLSFFCFQDIENDNPDTIGIKVYFFKNTDKLVRNSQAPLLTEGNRIKQEAALLFVETYDLPENYDSIWTDDFEFDCDKYDNFWGYFRDLNFENMLGYTRSTTGGDPTAHKTDRHLIILETSCDTRLHIQIPQNALLNSDFDKVKLSWVDFN